VTEKQFLLIVNCLVLNIVAVSSFLRVPVLAIYWNSSSWFGIELCQSACSPVP